MKQILIYIVFLVVGMVTGWLCRNHFRDEVEMVQIDSVVIRDTIREYQPIEIHKETIDTIYVAVEKPILIKDTLYVSLPLERKVYASDEYYAEVTGYRPSLDYIEVFPKTTIITRTVQNPAPKNTLSIGVEMGYLNTLSLPVYLEYGRILHKNVEIYGQIGYDIPTNQLGVGIGAKAYIGW